MRSKRAVGVLRVETIGRIRRGYFLKGSSTNVRIRYPGWYGDSRFGGPIVGGRVSSVAQPGHSFRFRGRSFLAFALAPELPIADWLGELDGWLRRSEGFFAGRPVVLDLSGVADRGTRGTQHPPHGNRGSGSVLARPRAAHRCSGGERRSRSE